MSGQDTLAGRIRNHIETRPEATAFVFYRRHDEAGEALSWRALWREAANLAAHLPLPRSASDQGVLILCDDQRNFVVGLLAVWMTGAVAIPAAGGTTSNLVIRNQHIFRSARPDLVLHDQAASTLSELRALAPRTQFLAIPPSQAIAGGDAPKSPELRTRLLQFTSGSTSDPKPILLEQQELSAGCVAIEDVFELTSQSVGLHWLPLYHDMGLVGAVAQPMFTGGASVLLRPSVFIQRPLRWFELASEWRATITSAPNFAYERLCDVVGQASALDLSGLETVIIGGEPVRKETVDRLNAAYGPFGLRPEAIAPCYGMAEATLLVSSGRTGHGAEFLDRDNGAAIACLGPPVRDLQVEARDPETGHRLPDGNLGEIWLEGPMTGRVIRQGEDWRNPQGKTAIRTGDLGFIHAGALHVAGRTGSRMIIRGKNVNAEDIEALVLAALPPGTSTGVAAFGAKKAGTEVLYILVELAVRNGSLDLAALNRQIITTFGIKPEKVITLRRFSLPRTTSGKIRRAAVREAFEAGQYAAEALSHAG